MSKIVDVGCGTGFLGIYLGVKKPLKRIVFSDLFLLPLFSSFFNAYKNLNSKLFKNTKLIPSNGLSAIVDRFDTFDVVICAPPYIPHLNFKEILTLDAVSGTYLLEDVIIKTGKVCDTLILCCSSICEPEFKKALNMAKDNYVSVKEILLQEKIVPFRVDQVFKNKSFMKKLLDERRNYFVKDFQKDSPFRIWHKIRYYQINYKS